MSKLVFLDIDGTIRSYDGTIPDSTVEAIARAQANGHKICINSGRPYFQITDLLPGLSFDGIIAGTGSYVTYGGECLAHKVITQFTYLALCHYLLEHDCVFHLMTYKSQYVLRQCLPGFESLGEDLSRTSGISLADLAKNLPTVLDSPLDACEIEKILFISKSLSVEEIQKQWDTCFYIVPSSIPCPGYLSGEITPKHVTKSAGMRRIMERSGHSLQDVIAIGDSDNDIDMIRYAGLGIAMGNANDLTKAAADYVTTPLKEDGIYHAFAYAGLL